jgi:hypothetical protein
MIWAVPRFFWARNAAPPQCRNFKSPIGWFFASRPTNHNVTPHLFLLHVLAATSIIFVTHDIFIRCFLNPLTLRALERPSLRDVPSVARVSGSRDVTCKRSVTTSQKSHFVSITRTNFLSMFKEIIFVCCGNHATRNLHSMVNCKVL